MMICQECGLRAVVDDGHCGYCLSEIKQNNGLKANKIDMRRTMPPAGLPDPSNPTLRRCTHVVVAPQNGSLKGVKARRKNPPQ